MKSESKSYQACRVDEAFRFICDILNLSPQAFTNIEYECHMDTFVKLLLVYTLKWYEVSKGPIWVAKGKFTGK